MVEIDAGLRKEIDEIISRYPVKEAGMLPILYLLQERFGAVSDEVIKRTAEAIDVSPAKVYGVVSFYTLFKRPWEGKHTVWVCSTLPCALNGAGKIYDYLHAKLQVDRNGNSPDKLFTLKKQECLGACEEAVCIQIDDDYHFKVTSDVLDGLIEAMRAQERH